MFRTRYRAVGTAVLLILALALSACSATDGKKAAEAAQGVSVAAGHASTPHYTIAMITHVGPGQAFWDIERHGGLAAAAKDNITLRYSSDPDPTKQAALIHVDAVMTLDAQVALIALQAMQQAHSTAKLYTFDTNSQEIAKIKSGAVQWAVDQQPYLQGYEAVDALWLYLVNGDTLGGGRAVLTGPSFIDATNVAAVAQYAARGTR
jgi:simple sugar transport system substrate-binding protein